jgi:hypothetical protein
VQVSSHRGTPTDRPPDRPCTCIGVVRGCLQERAGTRHIIQLASFARAGHSLRGNVTPFAANAKIGVWTPSDCHASSQAGSSQFRVQSWTHPRCDRFRVNGYVCGISPPFSNLSRNLSLCGGFLPHLCQRRSMAQRDNRRLICTSPRHGLRAVVRCR